MILADKIIENRKKNGWSQEELADRLGVSRQSVSKWESAQAVPDMKKIVQMSGLFNVSTDYLLKDDIDAADPWDAAPVENDLLDEVRLISMEEASAFLEYNEKAASMTSTGVMLCILSPVLLILLSGLAEIGILSVPVEYASVGGTAILLIMIAFAVAMFLIAAMRGKPFEYLDELNIDTEYGVSGMVRNRRNDYAERHSRLIVIGVMLCVVSAVPLLLLMMLRYGNNTDLLPLLGVVSLLILCAAGVKLIVLTCMINGGFDKLLEEGDYTRLNKRISKYEGIYWAIAVALYLGISFATQNWGMTWIVWPIAGVVFAAYREVVKAIIRNRDRH